MNIIIFGATGGTGLQLLEQALQQGHTVTAFVRNANKLPDYLASHPQVTLVEGDVLNSEQVNQAVTGQDAVISALGGPVWKKSFSRSLGTRNIIKAMKAAGVRRFVSESTVGAGDSVVALPWIYRLITRFIPPHGYGEHEQQEAYIRDSHLDWVMVRPGALTDGPAKGSYRHDIDPTLIGSISRADVADFMLQQLTTNRYLHSAPSLAY